MKLTQWARNVCTCAECCRLQPDRLELRKEHIRVLRDGSYGKPYLSATALGEPPKNDNRARVRGAQSLRQGRRGRTD